jgi:hypothetical protein
MLAYNKLLRVRTSARGMALVIEHLPSKSKVLSSNLHTSKKQRESEQDCCLCVLAYVNDREVMLTHHLYT